MSGEWSRDRVLRLPAVDSHTGGEPTRVLLEAPPEVVADLGAGPMAERLDRLRRRHDWLRRAVVNEPRGGDVLVGALLLPPCDPAHATGVIFFNNVGYLGMCGHGAIGVAETLRLLGRLAVGHHRFETPVGAVNVELRGDGQVAVENVPALREIRRAVVAVPGAGLVVGDVAWGGNWFFIVDAASVPEGVCARGAAMTLADLPRLHEFARRIRAALDARPLLGGGRSAVIDHIKICGPPGRADAHCRSFVLCPGGAYDRSPCGTGTSAKLACLAEDGALAEGAVWRQESIVGSIFEASYRRDGEGRVIPTIVGRAFVTAELSLRLDPEDPFAAGVECGSTEPGAPRG